MHRGRPECSRSPVELRAAACLPPWAGGLSPHTPCWAWLQCHLAVAATFYGWETGLAVRISDLALPSSCTRWTSLHLWSISGSLVGLWPAVNRQKLGKQTSAVSHFCSKVWVLCASAVPRWGLMSFFWRASSCKRRNIGTPLTGEGKAYEKHRKTNTRISVTQHLCPDLEKCIKWEVILPWSSPIFWLISGTPRFTFPWREKINFHWGCQ